MGQRLSLHQILVVLLGTNNVYFQPPSTVKMKYPCIVYRRNKIDEKRANNRLYLHKHGYQIMVIDENPDSTIPDKVLSLPLCSFDRHYTADNLNHDVFNIYY
jgi:hypothetical protein